MMFGTLFKKLRQVIESVSDYFGTSVSISGDNIVIGSENDTDVNNANQIAANGSAFVFKKDVNNVWTETQKLKPTNGMTSLILVWMMYLYMEIILQSEQKRTTL